MHHVHGVRRDEVLCIAVGYHMHPTREYRNCLILDNSLYNVGLLRPLAAPLSGLLEHFDLDVAYKVVPFTTFEVYSFVHGFYAP